MQFHDLGLKEWHTPTIVKCCKCDQMARVATFPKEDGGNNYCVEHAREQIELWLEKVQERCEK